MNDWRLVSDRFPYLSLHLTLGRYSRQLDALLDTGFDGDLIVPNDYPTQGLQPVHYIDALSVDQSHISVPAFAGVVRVGEVEIVPALVLKFGNIPIVGINVVSHFSVTLDHGRRLIVVP